MALAGRLVAAGMPPVLPDDVPGGRLLRDAVGMAAIEAMNARDEALAEAIAVRTAREVIQQMGWEG